MKPIRFLLAMILGLSCVMAQAERVSDIASFKGVRSNPLVGYGLIVGLDGTGDSVTQSPFTGQSLVNMLSQLGVTVPPGVNLQVKNVAAVMVTADLPPFAKQGQNLDIVVSSMGNAKSLRGGTLLMTPLKGADGNVYALAQGNLLVSGAGAAANGSGVKINQLAVGRIPKGAIIEREVPFRLGNEDGSLDLELHQADFGNAKRLVDAINRDFNANLAYAMDARTIRILSPKDPNQRVSFIAQLESVRVLTEDLPAKVILNSRTGSIVMNKAVRLRESAVAHGNLSIVVKTTNQVSQPGAFAERGDTVQTQESDVTLEEDEAFLQVVEESARLSDVVSALNALGATPGDLMAILQALKASGALRAELEII